MISFENGFISVYMKMMAAIQNKLILSLEHSFISVVHDSSSDQVHYLQND